MLYSIHINQKAVVDAGFQLDLVDLAIFDFLSKYTNSPICKTMNDDGRTWWTVTYARVIEQMPIIGIKTNDGIYRRFKRLELSGILDFHPDNAKANTVWLAWARNYNKMFFTPGQKTEGAEIEPTPPRMENPTPPDGNPTHNNILLKYPLITLTSTDAEKVKQAIVENPMMVENFTRVRRLPKEKYAECLAAFEIEVATVPQRYENYGFLVKHFLNFSESRCRIESDQKNFTPKGSPAKAGRGFKAEAAESYTGKRLF